jgi:hypothetical protein
MIKGDIANNPVPRLVMVFEGLIGTFTDKTRGKFDLALRKGQWKKALELVELNELVVKNIYDLVYRQNFVVDIVTFIDPEFAEELEIFLEEEQVPVARIYFTTVERLSRSISNRPDIAAIYDGNNSHRFTYGSKGRMVDPTNPRFL